MRTPVEYTNNLKKGIITDQMLVDCLFSVNKRAKNWRDKHENVENMVATIDIGMTNMTTLEKPKSSEMSIIVKKKSFSPSCVLFAFTENSVAMSASVFMTTTHLMQDMRKMATLCGKIVFGTMIGAVKLGLGMLKIDQSQDTASFCSTT